MSDELQNWASNFTYSASKVHSPGSIEEVQELVSKASKVKALGTRHSFSSIADTSGDLIRMDRLNRIIGIDESGTSVTVEGGVRYGELCRYLGEQGYAIHNLASLPHITVAGACATSTHGSGDRNGSLATAVSSIDVVTAEGNLTPFTRGLRAASRNADWFEGIVVGLGGVGIVARLTLDIRPAFDVRQRVFENLPFTSLEKHFDAITSAAYSVSLFTDWSGPAINQVWLKSEVSDESLGDDFFGATPAKGPLHPIGHMPPDNCTAQMGEPGPWHERLAHFKLEYTPSAGEELQSEYLVPRPYALQAIAAIAGLRAQISPLIQISEIRTVAADSFWMSPFYRQDSVGIHFTWKKDWEGVKAVLPVIEQALAPFRARPHWGKLFTMEPATLHALYPRIGHFRRLLEELDRRGKFRNEFLDRYIF